MSAEVRLVAGTRVHSVGVETDETVLSGVAEERHEHSDKLSPQSAETCGRDRLRQVPVAAVSQAGASLVAIV